MAGIGVGGSAAGAGHLCRGYETAREAVSISYAVSRIFAVNGP